MVEDLLQLAAGVGHQRAGIIFAARQRTRDRDHANLGVAKSAKAPLRRRLKSVEAILIEDLVLHAHQDHLRRIHHRAAADRDDEIGAGLLGFASCSHHDFPRRVLRDAIKRAGISVAERRPQLLDLVGLGVKCSARDQEDAAGVKALGLLAQRLGRRLAIDHLVHRGELVAAGGLHVSLRWLAAPRAFATLDLPRLYEAAARIGRLTEEPSRKPISRPRMMRSASFMIRSINSFTDGISWISPAAMPQLQAPASMSPSIITLG